MPTGRYSGIVSSLSRKERRGSRAGCGGALWASPSDLRPLETSRHSLVRDLGASPGGPMSNSIPIATVLVFAFAGFAAEAGQPDSRTVVIGATLPLTGSEARGGVAFKEGYDLAIDEVQLAGRIEGSSGGLPVSLK